MTSGSLPPDTTALDLACAAHGWIFATRRRAAWGWSAGTGWLPLPRAGRKIEELHVVDSGFLAVLESGKRVGLWAPGAPGWVWWLDVPPDEDGRAASYGATWRGHRTVVVAQCGYSSERTFTLYRVDQEAPRRLRTLLHPDTGDLRAVEEEEGGARVRLFCEYGEVRVPVPTGASEDGRRMYLDGHSARVVNDLLFLGPERFSRHSPLTRVIDLTSGTRTEQPWPSPESSRPLQQAAAGGETGRLAGLIAFLESLPDPETSGSLFALLEKPGEPLVAATNEGIFRHGDFEPAGPPRPFTNRFVARHELLPLLLLVDPEGTALEAAREIVNRYSEGEAVALAYGAAFGSSAWERLAGAIAGETDVSVGPRILRRIAAKAGPPQPDLVLRLLGDDEPARRQLGALLAPGAAAGLATLRSGPETSPADLLFRERLLESLRHPAAEVRIAALKACAELEIYGASPAVRDLLREDQEDVRLAAVRALLRLGDAGPAEGTFLRDRMRTEAWPVRAAIVEELLRRWEPGSGEVALEALGDASGRVRHGAAEAFAERASELDPAGLLSLLDAWMIPMLGQKAAAAKGVSDPGPTTDDLPERIGKEVGMQDADDLKEDLPVVGPLIARLVLLGPALTALTQREDWDPIEADGEVDEEPARRFDEVLPGFLAVFPALLESVRKKGTTRTLAGLSDKVAPWDEELAKRIAVVALFRALDEHGAESGPGETGPAKSSLAARLGRIGRGKAGLSGCAERVRAVSGRNGPLALAALLVLAMRDDREARAELLRRIESGEVDPWWSVASAWALGRDDEGRRALARRVARARAVPIGRRLQVLEAVQQLDVELDPASDEALADFFDEVVRSREFPLSRRVEHAWALGGAGRIPGLQGLWQECEERGASAGKSRYEAALSLARAGDGRHVDDVRARWLGTRDVRAIDILSRFGDLRDLPDLEAAREFRVSPTQVDTAIAAIRAREGGG